MAEVNLVGVERKDLALRIALLDLNGEDGFLDFALDGFIEADREEIARELLRDRARAGHLTLHHVVGDRDEDACDAQPEVLLEPGVLGGQDGLPQRRRDLVVADDDTPLGGELANHLAIAREEARDRAGLVVVERADLGKVVSKRKQNAAQCSEQGRDDKEHRQARLPGDRGEDPSPGSFLFFHVDLHSN
jgi:hypothetical protein